MSGSTDRVGHLELVTSRIAELHWYEAHGLGSYEHKIKRYID
jgi:hypothetical protein